MSKYINCVPVDIHTDIVFAAEDAGIDIEYELLNDCGSVYEGDPEDELTHVSFYMPKSQVDKFEELLGSYNIAFELNDEDDVTDDETYVHDVVEYGCNKTFYWYSHTPTKYSRCKNKHVEHIGLVFPLV